MRGLAARVVGTVLVGLADQCVNIPGGLFDQVGKIDIQSREFVAGKTAVRSTDASIRFKEVLAERPATFNVR